VAGVTLEHHRARGIAHDQTDLAPVGRPRVEAGKQRSLVTHADGAVAKHPAQPPADAHPVLAHGIFLALHGAHLHPQGRVVLTPEAYLGQRLFGQFFQFCLIHRVCHLRGQAHKLVAGASGNRLRRKAVDLGVNQAHASAAREQQSPYQQG